MKENGFGLLEVLISLAIISIGLLGIATLNAATYRQALAAEFRQTAMFLGEDLKNRMSMNFVESRKGTTSTYNDPSQVNGVNNQSCSVASNCNNVQMAQLDLYQVYNLAKNLPNGQLKVCLDSSGTGSCNNSLSSGVALYSILITWNNGNVAEQLLAFTTP